VCVFSQLYQKTLDDITPFVAPRWVAFAVVVLLYLLRVWYAQGFYIITYALGIYILNLLIAFLSPSIDPSLDLEMVMRCPPSPHSTDPSTHKHIGRP